MMKTAIIIQIEQLGQYGLLSHISLKSRNLSRFYIHIEDKTETPCDVTNCRLIRQHVKKTTDDKQY